MRALTILLAIACTPFYAADWPMFRGPNAAGVSGDQNLPVEFGPGKNMVWRTPLPPGHSSPVLAGDSIFLTAVEDERLFTICLDRQSGRVKWRREAPRPRQEERHKSNNPAAPSAVSDGTNVYVFFGDFGLLAYGPDGNELWRQAMGPFNNPMGMGASPVLSGDLLLMICDQESGSYFTAIEKETGKTRWRVERPEYTRGFATPVLYKPEDGPLQAIIAGSYQLTSYEVATGKPVWWVGGLTWQLKPTPVMADGMIFVQGWAGGSDTGQQEFVETFEEALKRLDKNGDGRVGKEEVGDPKMLKEWSLLDLDRDGALDARDWSLYRSRRQAQNAIIGIKLGGKGDMTEKNTVWRYFKSLPNVPSPLWYDGVLYMMKEGGILTAFDPKTGDVLKQGRLTGALGLYFSSPVGADGKVYVISEEGKAVVLKAGGEWEILAVNDLGEGAHATPAMADGRIYLRTHQALYCFAKTQ